MSREAFLESANSEVAVAGKAGLITAVRRGEGPILARFEGNYASTTMTVPIAVGSLMEPGASAPHQITASLANSCTKDGEDFTVTGAKLDVLSFN